MGLKFLSVCCLVAGNSFVIAKAQPQNPKPPIRITADLSEAPRKLYHAEIEIPVAPGPLALVTPEWIPGEHAPAGPASCIAGVVFSVNGGPLPWRRDDVNLYEFHMTVPKGASVLHAHLDCIVTSRVTQKMAVLEWERLLLYPANTPVRDIPVEPSLIVPAGWGIGTALTPVNAASWPVPTSGTTTRFAVTNVEQLEDSPILAGQYFHEIVLAPEISPKHFLDVVADEPEDANLRPEALTAIANLVREGDALYRSHHYEQYHFLLTLSDDAGGEGLEHGQSSDNGVDEKSFSDADHQLDDADLLPHEFTHSWNGKYRRPAGLYQPDFATPQQGALLWVYEGMTQYLGEVLAARSGLETASQYRDLLANTAANLDAKSGRTWRTTEDTAIAGSLIRGGNSAWINWRRSQDYYQEGVLLWLDADTLIRSLTNNQKSLNDFARVFLGLGGNTEAKIVAYDFNELVRDLNEVVPYDWATFLRDRVEKINPRADLAGIERGGYKLVYADKQNAASATLAGLDGPQGVNAWYSLGIRVNSNGEISDVRRGGPADETGLAPNAKIVAVDGRMFSTDRLHAAIRDAKSSADPVRLIVESESYITTVAIPYHDGERYPALERVENTPDYLDDITKPLVVVAPAKQNPQGEPKKGQAQ